MRLIAGWKIHIIHYVAIKEQGPLLDHSILGYLILLVNILEIMY
jgi:hypothetical protein